MILICFHPIEFSQIPPINDQKKLQKENIDKNLHREHEQKRPEMSSNEFKRPQMTSNDLAKPEANVKKTSNKRNKNILKAGSVH